MPVVRACRSAASLALLLVLASCTSAADDSTLTLAQVTLAGSTSVQPFAERCGGVHASNPVRALTLAQLRDVYSGRIRNGGELGGRAKSITVRQPHE